MTVAEPPVALIPPPHLLIGGERLYDSDGGCTVHIYPASGRPTAEVLLGGAAEIDLAVRRAREATGPWRTMPAGERRDTLLRLACLLLAHADELAALQSLEVGLPTRLAGRTPGLAADFLRYNAGWLDKLGGEVIPTWPVRALDYTLDEPYGVVGLIVPGNGALVSMGQMLGPALAAGNTVVIKPPPAVPFTALRIGELALEAGLPPGVLNVVPGGPETGEALVRHPDIDKIHFTGSGATARRVLTAAADNLTPVGLELGGKSPHVIFADSDLRFAARLAMTGAVALSGQGCANGTRLLVEATAYDEVVKILTARLRRVPVGDPFDARTMMGPVMSEVACERILGVIGRASDQGAGRLVVGGERLGGELADGYFIGPTVFVDVDPASELAQDEIFGPVLAVTPFTGEAEAVALANGTRYGLGAYLHTNDLRRAHRVSQAVTTGSVWVNGAPGLLPSAPFGGVKQSGNGRTGGLSGIREFLRPKNVWVSL
jgi:aldehyde dehydrogenase (NAD+)